MRSLGLLLVASLSLLSGCGLIEEVDGPRREDFSFTAQPGNPDQAESPMTASELQRAALENVALDAPALEKKDGTLEPRFENIEEQAPVVPR
ncbi:MAG: hypothetical protein JST00_10425 [Deltaproteobacteria bacterium]|nr:hypothetical protein [Deltaproteobacteria bacterium]